MPSLKGHTRRVSMCLLQRMSLNFRLYCPQIREGKSAAQSVLLINPGKTRASSKQVDSSLSYSYYGLKCLVTLTAICLSVLPVLVILLPHAAFIFEWILGIKLRSCVCSYLPDTRNFCMLKKNSKIAWRNSRYNLQHFDKAFSSPLYPPPAFPKISIK